jgi:CheY-like chemotaxis protein
MEFRPKILVVDDDNATLKMMGEVLASLETEPRLVPSSPRAAKLIEEEKFDGAFLEWNMSEIDGLALARRIRRSRLNSKIPIIMLTDEDQQGALKRSFAAGVNYFFEKPLTKDRLRHLLNAARGQMLAERRRYQRVSITLPFFCQWEKVARTGTILNLSAIAALVALMDPPSEGTKLTAEFELPGHKKPFSLPADVYRVTPGPPDGGVPRVVIQFVHRRPAERHILEDFVEKALAEFSPSS